METLDHFPFQEKGASIYLNNDAGGGTFHVKIPCTSLEQDSNGCVV